MSCFCHMLHCSPHHNPTFCLHCASCEVRKQQLEQIYYPRLPSSTEVPCLGKSQGLMDSSRHKGGKPNIVPPVLTGQSRWLGGKYFWRIEKSHLSVEILDPAPLQMYSLECTSNYFSKKRYIFQTFPLKSGHNTDKGAESHREHQTCSSEDSEEIQGKPWLDCCQLYCFRNKSGSRWWEHC